MIPRNLLSVRVATGSVFGTRRSPVNISSRATIIKRIRKEWLAWQQLPWMESILQQQDVMVSLNCGISTRESAWINSQDTRIACTSSSHRLNITIARASEICCTRVQRMDRFEYGTHLINSPRMKTDTSMLCNSSILNQDNASCLNSIISSFQRPMTPISSRSSQSHER